jgi:co-chaperonin GroES (HSP10)|tara:strand:- start:73 stop:336 length:264 start_codon:yes stop_codon:yes gene_type:complete
MKLLKNYVLIAETVKEEKTAGGIILSGDVQLDKSSKPGLVIATGPECDTMNFKAGDRVYLQWSESMPINHEGQGAVIIKDTYIKAVI